MAFTAKILSWRFRRLNIVGCLLKRRPTKGAKGGGVFHGHPRTPPPPLATPLIKRPKFNGTPPLQPRFSMIYVWVHSKSSS